MAQAAKTAKLAFPGQTVKLHQEFQIGVHDKNDLGSFLGRCDIVLGSVKNAANLTAFKLKGWTDAETTAFQTTRDTFGPAEQIREHSKGGAKDTTTQKDTDAATLYENLLTIQNAADMQWPATDPANAGVRDEFLSNPITAATTRPRRHRRRRPRRKQRNLKSDLYDKRNERNSAPARSFFNPTTGKLSRTN